MRRLFACLALATAATFGVAMAADDPEIPEVPPAEPETLPPTPPPVPPPPPAPAPAPAPQQTVVVDVEEQRSIRFFAEATAWFTQPVGGDYVYATEINPQSSFVTKTHSLDLGTSDRARWRGGISFNDDVGAFVLTYWAAAIDEPISLLYPGNFIIGESLVYPLFAGLNNDGLSDGVSVQSGTGTRDTRLDFVRKAFKTSRLSTKWLAGLRFVDHTQSAEATYHVLASGLPPLINEGGNIQENLVPFADRGYRSSRFSGRGIELGFEGTYEVVPKLNLEAGFVYAMLRGNINADYASTTLLYTFTDPDTQEEFILSPSDYQEAFGNPANFAQLNQRAFSIGLTDRSSSASSAVLEVNLGFRFQVWRGLEVVGGLRQTRYDDAVMDLRPRDATVLPDGTLNVQTLDKEYRSIAYEGYYLGVAFTF